MIVEHLTLHDRVDAWFTGRDRDRTEPPVGAAGNLSHRRPHRPADLARDRAELGRHTGCDPTRWHLMQQVHGAAVAVVDADTPIGAELRAVDAIVTAEPDRPLGVQTADCVPVLLAGPTGVAAVHAGRRGVELDVVRAAIDALAELGSPAAELTAAIGPAIGGCCYEVPPAMRDAIAWRVPEAAATTTWGTPSLDLPAAVAAQLRGSGVGSVRRHDACTRCDADGRWFSHRADPTTGRQLGLVVRRAEGTR
jgi:polyphenol oxidase